MMNIILYGASEFGKIIDFYLTRESSYNVVAYTDTRSLQDGGSEFNEKPFCPFDKVQDIYPPSDYKMFVAVGYVQLNQIRKICMEKALLKGYDLISHISPTCIVWDDLIVGQNVFIFEGNIIQPKVIIKDGVILSRGNSIGHDSILEKYSFISNRVVLCGKCFIGEETFIGSNATIVDGVRVAARNLIGASALIRKDTNPDEVYVQDSTKKLDQNSSLFFRW